MPRRAAAGLGAVLALASVLPSLVWGFGEQAISVQLKSSHPNVIIRVTQPTSLRAVLDQFCSASGTACEGTAKAESLVMAPVSISGTWSEVVFKLFEGSKLNFVAYPPAQGTTGKLILGDRREFSEGIIAHPGSTESMSFEGGRRSEARPGTVYPDAHPVKATSGAVPVVAGESLPTVQSMHAERVGAAGVGTTQPPVVGSAEAESGSVPLSSPFPDAYGRATPPVSGTATHMPFPDGKGDPIPVIPKAQGEKIEWPFPTQQPKP
jgi:hypothetical protein